jgi:hypothetical protein
MNTLMLITTNGSAQRERRDANLRDVRAARREVSSYKLALIRVITDPNQPRVAQTLR